MVSGRPVFKLLALSFVLAFVLVACVRPLSQSDEALEAEATATAEAEAVTATEDEAAGEGATEDVSSEEGAPGEGVSEEGVSEEGAPEEGASEEEASEAETGEGGEADGSGEGAAEEESPRSEGEESEEAVGGTESEDENVGGGAPETAEEASEETTTTEEPATGEAAAGGESTESTTTLPATHTVAAGENLYRIGLKYGMSWVVLSRYNNLPNPDRIYAGQVLQIPGGQPPPSQPPPQQPEYTSYVVKSGDNLFRIGLAFGVSWVDIAAANGIVNPNVIYPGQVLKIPTTSPGHPPQLTHTVQSGETLFRISLRYGVSWIAIAQANNIHSPYVIYPGQTLIIPSG